MLVVRCTTAVHPRVCGERQRDAYQRLQPIGSSPRVRGTLGESRELGRVARFIPACAGNAGFHARGFRLAAVHPRVCGERDQLDIGRLERRGSSPRVRGTPGQRQIVQIAARFIPACAGNAASNISHGRLSSVHPRVCGERIHAIPQNSTKRGSSPRVRGTPARRSGTGPRSRFIPACAGNAGSWGGRSGGPAVHPRVCGERGRRAPGIAVGRGSSPRVRGTPPDGL